MEYVKDKERTAYTSLKGAFGYGNAMQAPRLAKVVVSVGTGSVKDAKKIEVIQDRLMKITGQKSAARSAKKSIATWKTRAGDTIGFQVTLRGQRMYDFLNRLLAIALPRTKDFRGIVPTAVDGMGNLTIGIKEHTIFPETADEDIREVFGLAVTIVTTARSADEARAFLMHVGVPFRKDGTSAEKKPQ